MADNWRLIFDPPGEPEANMASDEMIAREVLEGSSPLTLRIYRWERPAVSLGRRQKREQLPPGILDRSIPMVWRPTGGGAVLHSVEELTYAVAVPPRKVPAGVRFSQVPGRIHGFLRENLLMTEGFPPADLELVASDSGGPYTLCFSAPVAGDLLLKGRKTAGSALRVWKDVLLLQGSIQGIPVSEKRLREKLVLSVMRAFEE